MEPLGSPDTVVVEYRVRKECLYAQCHSVPSFSELLVGAARSLLDILFRNLQLSIHQNHFAYLIASIFVIGCSGERALFANSPLLFPAPTSSSFATPPAILLGSPFSSIH